MHLPSPRAEPFAGEATFVTGADHPGSYPPEPFPEVAFVGRSNVGKSALLNRLLNRRKLARVSRTPGCTRRINFFRVKDRWWFVDLPGYGFAQVAAAESRQWDKTIGAYLRSRTDLRAVILLIDLRRGILDMDRTMIALLHAQAIPFLPVATKVDKLNRRDRDRNLGQLRRDLSRLSPLGPVAPSSALSGEGIAPLQQRLLELLTAAEPATTEPATTEPAALGGPATASPFPISPDAAAAAGKAP
ncbi:MAG: YihA family ribosome biogenesis GTP-binding protein [Magnetococcales bacterium]|nr:YihA family ribosome biogenesis GTP-binding protein [Magnetococcales bacterium]